jgi:hypothetical protein
MNNNDLPKGYIPAKEKKRWWLSWKFFVTLFLFLLVADLVRKGENRSVSEELNRRGPALASAYDGLSPQEIEHFQSVRDKMDEILRKYLTPEEYEQSLSFGVKVRQGTTAANEIDESLMLLKKIRSLASPAEKETLDEFSRLTQKLAGMQK